MSTADIPEEIEFNESVESSFDRLGSHLNPPQSNIPRTQHAYEDRSMHYPLPISAPESPENFRSLIEQNESEGSIDITERGNQSKPSKPNVDTEKMVHVASEKNFDEQDSVDISELLLLKNSIYLTKQAKNLDFHSPEVQKEADQFQNEMRQEGKLDESKELENERSTTKKYENQEGGTNQRVANLESRETKLSTEIISHKQILEEPEDEYSEIEFDTLKLRGKKRPNSGNTKDVINTTAEAAEIMEMKKIQMRSNSAGNTYASETEYSKSSEINSRAEISKKKNRKRGKSEVPTPQFEVRIDKLESVSQGDLSSSTGFKGKNKHKKRSSEQEVLYQIEKLQKESHGTSQIHHQALQFQFPQNNFGGMQTQPFFYGYRPPNDQFGYPQNGLFMHPQELMVQTGMKQWIPIVNQQFQYPAIQEEISRKQENNAHPKSEKVMRKVYNNQSIDETFMDQQKKDAMKIPITSLVPKQETESNREISDNSFQKNAVYPLASVPDNNINVKAGIITAIQKNETPPLSKQEIIEPLPPTTSSSVAIQPAIIPPVASGEIEQQRLAALYSTGILDNTERMILLTVDPRLNKIVQMTSRLLGRSGCVLSLVDTDKVIWKASSWTLTTKVNIKEEARYESFCSWVVQDETGRGITILDARSDPRCSHMRVKAGLEFYAGVPLLLGGKYRIGALSIQGPASAQMSLIDMNILHEMAVWASGELDTIILQKSLEETQIMLAAHKKLNQLAQTFGSIDKTFDRELMEKSLSILNDTLNSSCVLLLKLNPDIKGFQSVLSAYAISSLSKTTSLPVGDEMFRDLSLMTLKRENMSLPLLLEGLKTGPVTKDVDFYLHKKINKCISDVLWGPNGPSAIIAAFFEGSFRVISLQDQLHFKNVASTISNLLEQVELCEAFSQAQNLFKNVTSSLRKNPISFGSSQGLAPVIAVIQPKFPTIKGMKSFDLRLDGETEERRVKYFAGPKGKALAQALAQRQEVDALMGYTDTTSTSDIRASTSVLYEKSLEIQGIECFELQNDFNQILDNLTDKNALKRAKKFGNQYYILANYGPDFGTFDNVANVAHELFFALDVYNQNKKKSLSAQIGIHCDFVSTELAGDANISKDFFQAMLNTAYNLQQLSEGTLVSETFYHQTKHYCSYEAASLIVLRGQGAFSSYKLIGKTHEIPNTEPIKVKDNGINDKCSLVLDTLVVTTQPVQTPAIVNVTEDIRDLVPVKSMRSKKKCIIL